MATSQRRGGKAKIMAPRKHGPEFSAEKTWSELSKNIREIQNQNASNLSFEENHRYAYNMVLNKHGETLYKGMKSLVIENLDTMAGERIIPVFPSGTKDISVQSDEDKLLLDMLKNVWEEHNNNMVRLGQILKYMDRVYTKPASVPPTHELGLELFLKQIMKSPIKDHVMRSVLNQIRHEREGYGIGRSSVKGCVDVFLSLQADNSTTVYKRDLEPMILTESERFYSMEGLHLLNSCSAHEFLKCAENRFREEDARTHHYLPSQTSSPLSQILKDNLLTPHLSSVISKDTGLDSMIDGKKVEDLSRLFELCSLVPTGLTSLKSALRESIIRRGKGVNDASVSEEFVDVEAELGSAEGSEKKEKGKGRARPPLNGIQPALDWVHGVLDLKDTFDTVWRTSFQSSRDIETCIIGAFESFINMNEKCSEFISLFIDDHLKRGLKGKTEIEVDAVLDKTITLFRFIAEKDVFEKYYKGHLAKRLLLGRSVSDDAERGMLAKLKTECGFQFTQKMEGMFTDMKVSADTTKDYMEHVSKTTAPEIELGVTVMTSGAWPMNHSSSSCNLPSQMAKACQSFEQFYLSRRSGRRLTWQYSLGNADVNVKFKARSHELNVATFALVILLLFEGHDILTYAKIKEASGIEEAELKRHLQSLACAKFKILKKHPSGREINSDDSFSFNNDFSCPMKKVKIATVSSKLENSQERKETRERVDEERKAVMEACIVRIMKNRKHLSHNELVHEVTSQLSSKFQPEPFAIKKRIEHLIDREYLTRGDDRKSYDYLA